MYYAYSSETSHQKTALPYFPSDDTIAINWLRKAVAQDNARATLLLANELLSLRAIPIDQAQAIALYQRLSNNSNDNIRKIARSRLKVLSYNQELIKENQHIEGWYSDAIFTCSDTVKSLMPDQITISDPNAAALLYNARLCVNDAIAEEKANAYQLLSRWYSPHISRQEKLSYGWAFLASNDDPSIDFRTIFPYDVYLSEKERYLGVYAAKWDLYEIKGQQINAEHQNPSETQRAILWRDTKKQLLTETNRIADHANNKLYDKALNKIDQMINSKSAKTQSPTSQLILKREKLRILDQMQDYDAAFDLLRTLTATDVAPWPQQADMIKALSRYYFMFGQYEQAIDTLDLLSNNNAKIQR